MSQRSDEDLPPISPALLDRTDMSVLGKRSRSEATNDQARSVADLEALRRLANTQQRSGASNLSALRISSGIPTSSTYGMSTREETRRETFGLPGPGIFQGAPDTPGAPAPRAKAPILGTPITKTVVSVTPVQDSSRAIGQSVITNDKPIEEVNTLLATPRTREETADSANNKFFDVQIPDSDAGRNEIVALIQPDLLDTNVQCIFWPSPIFRYLKDAQKFQFVTSTSVFGMLCRKELEFTGPATESVKYQNLRATQRAYQFWEEVRTTIHNSKIADKQAYYGSYTTTFFDDGMNNILADLKKEFPESQCDRLQITTQLPIVGSPQEVRSIGTELANQYFFATKILHGPMFEIRDMGATDSVVKQVYLDAFARLSKAFEVFQKHELAVNDIRVGTIAERFEATVPDDETKPFDLVFTNFGFSCKRDPSEASTNSILQLLAEKRYLGTRETRQTPVQEKASKAYKNDFHDLYADYYQTSVLPDHRIYALYLNDMYQFLNVFVEWLSAQTAPNIQYLGFIRQEKYIPFPKTKLIQRIQTFMEALKDRVPAIVQDPFCRKGTAQKPVSLVIAEYIHKQFQKLATPNKEIGESAYKDRASTCFNLDLKNANEEIFCGRFPLQTAIVRTRTPTIRTTAPLRHLLDNMQERMELAQTISNNMFSFDDLLFAFTLGRTPAPGLPGFDIQRIETEDVFGAPMSLFQQELRPEAKPKRSRIQTEDMDDTSSV